MKLKQLSVFLENKPGRLTSPARALADAAIQVLQSRGINVVGSVQLFAGDTG